MVDEDAFRTTWHELETLPCPFAKALLGGFAACPRQQRIHLADRVGVDCDALPAQLDCVRYVEALRDASGPVLRARHPGEALPHGLQLKLQVGGLRGLRRLLHGAEEGAAPVDDVRALLVAAGGRGSLDTLPYEELVADVVAFEARRRR